MAARYDSGTAPLSPALGSFDAQPAAHGYGGDGDITPAPSASSASLPRYPGNGGSSQNVARPHSGGSSIYSTYATNGGNGGGGIGSRAAAYGADPSGRPHAHPLSQQFGESTPTLAGSSMSVHKTAHDEKGAYQRAAGGNGATPAVPVVSQIGRANAGFRPQPSGLKGLYWRWGGGNAAQKLDDRLAKPERDGWIDGFKFFAAAVVANGTFFNAVLADTDYSAIQRGSPLYVFRSFGLGLSVLLVLLGRAYATHLWDSPHNAQSAPASTPSISWARLTRAMLVRPFRFILPVLVIAAVQWALGATGKTGDCNAVGMDEPIWSQISNFGGYVTVIFDSFTWFEWETVGAKAFAGNLWTNAWFFQSSYCVLVVHMMLGNLSSNRYWVYGALAFFSWCTFNFFALAIIGLALADMHVHGQWARLQRLNVGIRLAILAVLVGLVVLVQFINPVRNGLNSGLATINVTNHTDLTFADLITATCFVSIVELSPWIQIVLGNVVFRAIGRVTTAGLYLISAVMTFTAVPTLALSMSRNGSSPSSITGLTWLLMFGASFLLAIPFHFFIELPSKHFGERFANFVTTFGSETAPTRTVDGRPTKGNRLRDAIHAPAPAKRG